MKTSQILSGGNGFYSALLVLSFLSHREELSKLAR